MIEWATNTNYEPKIHFGYSARIGGNQAFCHSELAAYNKAKGLIAGEKSFELVNIRLNKAGELRLSKPCICCSQVLRSLGCSKFYYSYQHGFLSC